MNFVSIVLQFANILLQCLLVIWMLRGFIRRYSILLVYSGAYLSATLIGEILLRREGIHSSTYRTFYWGGELVLDLLLFLTVMVLIDQALDGSPVRSRAGPWLAGIATLALCLPFVVLKAPLFSHRWFFGASQILNFGAALLNLALWTALLLRKRRDPRLLGVSLGVGVTVTSAAIGYGLLLLLASGHDLIDLFAAVAHTAGVVLWCRAFAVRA